MNSDDHTKVISQGRFTTYLNKNGWEYVERVNRTEAVFILAVTEKKRLLLVEQFRPPLNKNVIELPAGLIGDKGLNKDERIEEAADRELEEETGYRAEEFGFLIKGPISAGLTSEFGTLLEAKNIKKVSDGGGEGGENITVHEIPVSEIEKWLVDVQKKDVLVDPKVYAALYFLNKAK